MRVGRVELVSTVKCALCDTSSRLSVEVANVIGGVTLKWHVCIPCARRVGVAAMGGRWGNR